MNSTPQRQGAIDASSQAADLAALRRMLLVSRGTFSLSFAVCDDRNLRDSLIRRLLIDFPDSVAVAAPANVNDIYDYVRSQLPAKPPAAIFVLDLEPSIPHEGDSQPTLRVLNSSREQWERLACPVVFWLAEYAIIRLMRHAPDFWRYRSHQFEFIPDVVPIREATKEAPASFEMVDALPFEEKAFRVAELEHRLREAENPPPDDLLPHVLNWTYELARLYEHASRFQDSEKLKRLALTWAEKSYGDNSNQFSTALNNLAQLLQDTNRLVEAEPLMHRTLPIDEAIFGKEHPNVAIPLNNLGQLLKDTNRFVEAEPLMRRALAIDEASFGLDHPRVARDLNNLAQLLEATNRLAEAEPLMRRALAIDEASYAHDHLNVARDLNNLAHLLQSTNRHAEAEPLMRRALAIAEASFGQNHPKVATCLNNLAQLLQATNRLAEAEPLMRRALASDEASFGKDHPSVAISLNNLAALLQATDRPAEAEQLMRRALSILSASFGQENQRTQTVQRNLDALMAAEALSNARKS